MADTVKIRLEIDTSTGAKNVKDLVSDIRNNVAGLKGDVKLIDQKSLADAQKQLKAIANELAKLQGLKNVTSPKVDTSGLIALSKAFKQTYGESLNFANSLKLSGAAANDVFQRFSQLRGAGANTIEAYRALTKEFGLNAQQLKIVNKAYQDLQVRQHVAARQAAATAAAQVKPFKDASDTIAKLSLEVAKPRVGTATGNEAQMLSKQAALFQENLRYKQQLAKINNAGFSPQDVANAKALADQLNKINVRGIEQQFDQLSDSTRAGLGKLAGAAGAGAAAIAGLFTEGIKQFAEFDGAIRQAGVISGGSADQIGVLREEVTRLGIVTSKAPAEIARTAVSLAKAGFSAEEAAQSLEGIVRASEATGESLEIVGDIIAKTLRVFSLTARQSTEVADLLVTTANSTNTSVQGLGESLKFVGPAAAASNQSLSDTLVLLGLLGDAGIQNTSAGTGLAEFLQRLKTASAGANTEFQGLVRGQKGATAAFEAIGVAVRGTDGSLKSVLDVLPQLKQSLTGFSREDQDVLSKALFGTQGGRVFQVLLNATPERIAKIRQEIENSENAAKESGVALLQGLSGAFASFGSAISTALISFGEFAAIGLEPLVRLATNVINTFNGFPPVFQNALIAITGLGGAILAATSLTLAYQAINGKLIAQQILEAAILVRNTAATAISTKAKQAAALAETLFAAATGRATAAQQAQVAQLGAGIAKYGLLAAAVGSVALAFEALQSSANLNKDIIADADAAEKALLELRNSLVELDEQIEGTRSIDEVVAGNLESLTSDLNPILKFIDDIRVKLQSLPPPVRDFVEAFNPIANLLGNTATETERAVDRQSQEFGRLTDSAEGSLQEFEALMASENGLADATTNELDKLLGSLDASAQGIEKSNPGLRENIVARERYIDSLQAAREQVQKAIDDTKKLGAAEGDTEAIENRTKALEEAEKERQRIAKQARDDQREDDERELNRQLDDERRDRQEANQKELADQQKADAEEIAAIEKENSRAIAQQEKADALEVAELEKQLQSELQDAERAFEEQISAFEEQRQRGLQAKEESFQRSQQQQEAAFQDQQRAIEQQFQEEQRQRNEQQGQNFDRAEQLADLEAANTIAQRQNIEQQIRAVDRVAGLDLANQILSPERINQLAQQIAEVGSSVDNEDEARRVQEALGLIRAEQQRQQAEADRVAEEERQAAAQAREAKFQAEQEARRVAFEEVIAQQRATLEAEIEQRKLDFETNTLTPLKAAQEAELAALREEQEIALTAVREQQEFDLQALREQQELELEQRRSEFEATERALDRAYEDAKIARDRAYREEQRRLDLENEQAIARIRERSSGTPNQTPTRETAFGPDASFGFSARGLRKGGTYQAGEPLQLHKDEFVIPSTDGTVLSQRASRAVVREAIAANPHLIAANLRRGAGVSRAPVRAGGRSATDDKLLKEMQGLRRDLKQLGRPTETTNLNVGVSDRRTALKEKARQLSNELSRRS